MIQTIRALIAADVPVLLWGPPGTGKTSALLALAREEKAVAEVLIGSQVDPIDTGGILIPNNGNVVNVPPPWALRLKAALDAGKNAWFFLDELSCSPPAVQAAFLRIVQERCVAGLDLRGIRVVGAANPADTAAAEGDLSAATANRWGHLDWAVNVNAWVIGELSGWGGKSLSGSTAAAASSIAAWIARSPNSLLAVPSDPAYAGRAWPSPRSWSAAIRALAVSGVNAAYSRQLVASCVGDGAASEWYTWQIARDLPDPEEILAGRAHVPDRGDQAAATLMAVAAAAASDHKLRGERMDTAWKILASVRPDIALTAARALLESSGGEVPVVAAEIGRRLRGVGA